MKKRILVIDDEPDFTSMLKYTLEADGYYEVHFENDATRAVTAAREVDPDLFILDVMMPDLDGSDVAALLREDPHFARTPILFLTALALGHESGVGGFASDSGPAQTYLPKSAPTDQLIDCIEKKLSAASAAAPTPVSVAADEDEEEEAF